MLAQSTTVPVRVGMCRASQPGQQPAQGHPGARVDPDDLPAAVEPGDLDLVGPDEPGALEVDEVAGQEVLDQQELARAAVEALEVDGLAHQLDARPGRMSAMRSMGTNRERWPMRTTRPDRGGWGVSPRLDDEVLDPAQAVAVAVHERALHHARQVKDLDGHASVLLEQRRYPQLPTYLVRRSLRRDRWRRPPEAMAPTSHVLRPETHPGKADRPWSPSWGTDLPKNPWTRLVEIRRVLGAQQAHRGASPARAPRPPAPGGLRIAYLVYRGNPRCGGQGVYTRHLARELVGLGHSVEVFAGQPWPELDDGVGFTPVPGLDLYRDPDPFRVPHPREFRSRDDLLEFAVMCTAGFPEPRTFSLRARRLLAGRRDDFDIVHDNQCLGSGLLGMLDDGWPLLTTLAPPDHRRPRAGAVARRERLPAADPAAVVRLPGHADQGGPEAAHGGDGVGVLQGGHRGSR